MPKDKFPLRPATGFSPAIGKRSRLRREQLAGLARLETQPSAKRNDLAPNTRLETHLIADLKAAKRRVRKEDPVQVTRIVHSIKEFGCCRPILVTDDLEIIDGHSVVAAAKICGLEQIRCVVMDHLTDVDVRRFRIAVNRIGETGSWDEDVFFDEVRRIVSELSARPTFPGIDPEEIDAILQSELSVSLDLDASPKLGDKPISRVGDIWRMAGHRLGCGDARDKKFLQDVLAENLANLALTDPPYGVAIGGHVTRGDHREFVMGAGEMSRTEFGAFLDASLQVIFDALAEGGLCMPFMDWRGYEAIVYAARKAGFDQLNLVMWNKSNAGMGSLYRSQHELLPVFKKGKAPHTNNVQLGRKGRYRSNVWTYPGASSLGSDSRRGLADHPTVKPVALLEDAILDVTRRGDIVLDPFAGSGSTLIAAEKTSRVFCGVELDPLYVDLILRRWISLFGGDPFNDTSKMTFSELEQERTQ